MKDNTTANHWQDIAIFHDGSGKAGDKLRRNMEILTERVKDIQAVRDFISKHYETLAGAWWDVAYFDPEIKLSPHYYRGRKTTPGDIATLWPEAIWTRRADKYGAPGKFDWVTQIDGIDLVIEGAEVEDPRPRLKSGKIVHRPRRKTAVA
jgi:hypothetical protein